MGTPPGPGPGPRRIGRREAERLLAREPATADRAGLAEVLAHAAAPPMPDELHGGDTALAEYVRAVSRARARPTTLSRPRASTVDARSRRAVQLACAVVAAALGGVMWAAQAGALPAPAQQLVHDLLGPVGVPAPAPRDNTTAPDAVPPTTHTTAAPTAQPGTEPGRDEPPPMEALCRAHLDHQNDPANAPPLDPAAADRLTRAANGPAKVDDYCGTLLAEHASDRDWPNATQPPDVPTPTARPTPHTDADRDPDPDPGRAAATAP